MAVPISALEAWNAVMVDRPPKLVCLESGCAAPDLGEIVTGPILVWEGSDKFDVCVTTTTTWADSDQRKTLFYKTLRSKLLQKQSVMHAPPPSSPEDDSPWVCVGCERALHEKAPFVYIDNPFHDQKCRDTTASTWCFKCLSNWSFHCREQNLEPHCPNCRSPYQEEYNFYLVYPSSVHKRSA